jgi:acyl-CoA thioesterase
MEWRMSIPQIIADAQPREGGFSATIPAPWHQGRTAYGGVSSALALEAARRLADDLPPLRSAQVSFIGPLSGEVNVQARMMRRGRNASWVQADVSGEGGVGLSATFVFMSAMESALHLNDFPSPARVQPEDASGGDYLRGMPDFLPNFDWRHALPKSETPKPEICRWMRLKDRDGLDPMVEILAVADALPPGVLPLLGKPVALSSMTWICNLLTPEPKTRDGWWLLRSWGNYSEHGCSSQSMGIWNTDGEPVASGMQSIALFG